MSDDTRTSYVIRYLTGQPCDLVFTLDTVTRIARRSQILSVTEKVTVWEGSWEDGTRHMKVLSEKELGPDEY